MTLLTPGTGEARDRAAFVVDLAEYRRQRLHRSPTTDETRPDWLPRRRRTLQPRDIAHRARMLRHLEEARG